MKTPIIFSIEILDQENSNDINISKSFSTNTPRTIINSLRDIIKELETSSAKILNRQLEEMNKE